MGISLCPILVGIPDFLEWYLKKIAFFLSGLHFKNTKNLVGMVIVMESFFHFDRLSIKFNRKYRTHAQQAFANNSRL
jgi:hypothetical protein